MARPFSLKQETWELFVAHKADEEKIDVDRLVESIEDLDELDQEVAFISQYQKNQD